MRKRTFLTVVLSSALFVIILNFIGLPRFSFKSIFERPPKVNAGAYEAAARVYTPAFKLDAEPNGSFAQFLPVTPYVTPAFAESFAYTFNICGSAAETATAFIYEDGDYRLTVSKNEGFLSLENMREYTRGEPVDSARASELAEDFLKRFFFTNYVQVSVFADKNGFEAEFIPLLSGIKKSGLNTKLSLDRYGNVQNMIYYFFTYENFARCPIMSEYDAFCALPASPAGSAAADARETPVTLTDCELVYVYENSIVQPAYMFRGYTKTGKAFSCPVSASVYD